MNIIKELVNAEVTEKREVEEVVLRMSVDEARMLTHWLGRSNGVSIYHAHTNWLDQDETTYKEARMAKKIGDKPYETANRVALLFYSLLEKLS